MNELTKLMQQNESLMGMVVKLSSEALDLRIANASLMRALDTISKAFKELDTEQAFHDAIRRTNA